MRGCNSRKRSCISLPVYRWLVKPGVGVEKGALDGINLRLQVSLLHECFSVGVLQLRRRSQHWSWSLAQEADQSLDVLSCRRQEELRTHKLHPA
jgi:hypothetical protein